MKIVLVCLLCLPLSGCFFFWMPLRSSTDTAGNACINTAYNIGDQVRMNDGNMRTVQKLYGRSSRCSDESRPILADLMFTGESKP